MPRQPLEVHQERVLRVLCCRVSGLVLMEGVGLKGDGVWSGFRVLSKGFSVEVSGMEFINRVYGDDLNRV